MFAIMAQAFIALFVTVDPVGNMPLFLSLTAEADAAHRRRMALQGPAVATVVLVVFALAGEPLLRLFGITLPAFRIAGGLLLFALAFEMLFAKRGPRRAQDTEAARSHAEPEDVAVFPLAIPLLAGPGGIASVILLTSEGGGQAQVAVLLMIPVVMGISALCFLAAGRLERLLGMNVTEALTRVLGVVLAALAVQSVVDGVKAIAA